MKYINNTKTRRTLVQTVYQNHYSFKNDCDFYLKDNGLISQNIFNGDLFTEVINKVFFLWDTYEDIFEKHGFFTKSLSVVSISIIKTAIAEAILYPDRYKIIFNDYLNISKSFCSSEKPVINKILDTFVKKDNLFTLD